MSLTTDSMSAADLKAVVDGNDRGGFFGGDGLYAIIVLFILMAMINGGWGGGFGGGMNGGGMYPWLAAGQANANNDVQRGFDQSALMTGINGINGAVNAGFAGVNQALCGGFAGVNATINGGFSAAEIAANARQIANMQQAFNAQTAIDSRIDTVAAALQNCCCENRAGLADVKYTIATENCQDRYEAAQNTRDIIEAMNAKVQSVTDKLCQLELDGKNQRIAELQQQLTAANLAASQTAQTARILADNAAQTTALEQYLNPAPIPAYVVPSPNCCNQTFGCGA